MESANTNQKKNGKQKISLLPDYFKKIGIAVLILAFLPAIFIKIKGIGLAQVQYENFKVLSTNFFIFGLLLFALTKDKIENEITISLRLKSAGFTFILAVLYVVINPLINLLFADPIADLNSQELVLNMLIVYLILYSLQKRASKTKILAALNKYSTEY